MLNTMTEASEKLSIGDLGGLDQSKYLIYSRLEIASILERLRKSRSMLTAYFGGDDFFLTSIVAVMADDNKLIIDCGADAACNQRALQAKAITFAAAHERIKIQFVGERLSAARFGGRDSFSVQLPATLLRLQRREYFRVATPLMRPLKCMVGPQSAALRAPAELTIVDISCGGIAIIDAEQPGDIETGMCFQGCRIQLPELGVVITDIMVRSTFAVAFKSGARHKRAGCEFVNMRERERSLIQRYINKLERERKERTGVR